MINFTSRFRCRIESPQVTLKGYGTSQVSKQDIVSRFLNCGSRSSEAMFFGRSISFDPYISRPWWGSGTISDRICLSPSKAASCWRKDTAWGTSSGPNCEAVIRSAPGASKVRREGWLSLPHCRVGSEPESKQTIKSRRLTCLSPGNKPRQQKCMTFIRSILRAQRTTCRPFLLREAVFAKQSSSGLLEDCFGAKWKPGIVLMMDQVTD